VGQQQVGSSGNEQQVLGSATSCLYRAATVNLTEIINRGPISPASTLPGENPVHHFFPDDPKVCYASFQEMHISCMDRPPPQYAINPCSQSFVKFVPL
jgi:hypothetical protein